MHKTKKATCKNIVCPYANCHTYKLYTKKTLLQHYQHRESFHSVSMVLPKLIIWHFPDFPISYRLAKCPRCKKLFERLGLLNSHIEMCWRWRNWKGDTVKFMTLLKGWKQSSCAEVNRLLNAKEELGDEGDSTARL